jgi:hypothetical protein
MSAATLTLPAYISGDADFQTWVTGIHNEISALGLVQTADTGQINPATVARPGTSTFAGYEIWRFADSLQATKPVFLKIEYGIGAAADRPALAMTVGTGSTGAGVLNGQVGTRRTLLAGASKTAGATLPTYMSGGTGRLTIVANADSSANNFTLGLTVERTKDATGADTGDGIVFVSGTTTTVKTCVIPFGGSVPADASVPPCLGPADAGQASSGTDVALSPGMVFSAGKALFCMVLGMASGAIPGPATFTTTYLGSTRTFVSTGAGLAPTSPATITMNVAWAYE